MKKVLIVEDEGIVAKDIEAMLRNLGYHVSGIASSGEKAIQNAAKTRPDLVLMDILLKGKMDGVEAAEKIGKFFDIPVVYLTAYADENTLQRAKITEPFGYLLKPLDESDLHTTIETALYKSRMERKLKEREQWLFTVLKSIGDAVITADNNGCITFMNPVAESLTGWEKNEAVGKNVKEILKIINKGPNNSLSSSSPEGIWEDNISLASQTILIKRENKEIQIDHNRAPVRDNKGNIMGSVMVFRDITPQKKAEESLKQSWEKLQKVTIDTIHAMALTVEMRDPYTAGHQRRVSQIAGAIAREMNLPEDKIKGIYTASLIHDVGKIHVPAEILSKPTKLSEVEFNLIKDHSQVGYQVLKSIDFPWPIARIVLQHHERINGSGYPSGLKGKIILKEAKILAVADVVEAMSSHRPYRPALGVKKALQEISTKKGVLYDSRVVDACLRIFTENSFKFK